MFNVLVLALVLLTGALIIVLLMLWRKTQAKVSTSPPPADPNLLAAISKRVSERLYFRPPLLADGDFFVVMASDPTASEANGWDGTEPAVTRARFANSNAFKLFQQNELVAVEHETGKLVGTATFSPAAQSHPGARSAGIHVHHDHRNQGYGREIMAAAILWLQTSPGPIIVGTRVDNIGLQRIMEQLGYAAEPETNPFPAPNGQSYEAYWYWCGVDVHPPQLHQPPGLFEE